jgi:Tol biopolymer transport system component
MKRIRLWSALGAAIVAAAIAAPPFLAQQRFLQNPKDEAALRAAIEKETVQGDVKGAIEQYKKLAQNNNKSLAARALVRLGQAYEKLGIVDARRTYEQVLSKFADQKEAADQARDRLSSLGVGPAVGLATRKLEEFDSLSISPDGRYIAYMDPESGDLGMRNTATGERRLLTHESRKMSNGYALGGAPFSPDGRQIAYLWDNSGNGNGSSCELRVTSTSGSGQPRTLLRCSQGTDIQWLEPSAWTPDGKSVLAVLIAPRDGKIVTSVATFSAVDGKVNELKTFDGSWAIGHPSISPDGAYVTYDRATSSDSPQRDIMILSTADLREATLIAGSASDDSPVWSGDGKSILFRSDRRGSVKDLMLQRVDQGRPQGSPEFVKTDIGNATILGLGTNGLLAFNQTTNLRRAYTAAFDPASGRVSQPAVLSERAMEGNVPHWSPDGKLLAMNFGNQIILRGRTGEERNFPAGFTTRSVMDWFPDGSVLVTGTNSEGKGVIVQYSFDPPRATALPGTVGGAYRFQSISPDGKTVYRAQDATGTRILAVDLQSGTTRTVIDIPWIRSLALSPDGQQIAYVEGNTNDASKSDTLHVIRVDGGQPRKVTEFARPLAAIGGLQWAPDGRHILVVVRGHGVDWVSVADGTVQPTGLTNVGGINTGLAGVDGISISPDGKDLAFTIGGNKTETWILQNFVPPASGR